MKIKADSTRITIYCICIFLRLKSIKSREIIHFSSTLIFFAWIFLQTGFSSIKICLHNIRFLALMCHSLGGSPFSEFQSCKWHISLANPFFSVTCFKQKANHNKKRWKAGEKGVLKNFTNFAEKQQCWSLFLIKLKAFSAMQLY